TEHLAGIEVLLYKSTGSPAMACVIALETPDGAARFRGGSVRQQALSARKESAKPGVLDNSRPAARQVPGSAVAEPTALCGDVAVLGHAKLGPRGLEILLICPWIARHAQRIGELPA